jgi:hypothetical protein
MNMEEKIETNIYRVSCIGLQPMTEAFLCVISFSQYHSSNSTKNRSKNFSRTLEGIRDLNLLTGFSCTWENRTYCIYGISTKPIQLYPYNI